METGFSCFFFLFFFFFSAVIELQTTCRKILLTVVETGKAKLPVKVFLVTAGCVAVVTAGPKVPLFSSRFELLLSQLVQRR